MKKILFSTLVASFAATASALAFDVNQTALGKFDVEATVDADDLETLSGSELDQLAVNAANLVKVDPAAAATVSAGLTSITQKATAPSNITAAEIDITNKILSNASSISNTTIGALNSISFDD